MKIPFNDTSLYVYSNTAEISETKLSIIFLHGFTGSSNDWLEIIEMLGDGVQCFALDFPGHGNSDSPKELDHYTEHSLVAQIKTVIKHFKLQNVILCGYSMGGRAALSFTVKHGKYLKGLILESASPGLKKKKERTERKDRDEALAKLIEEKGVEEFVDYWLALPMFETLSTLSEERVMDLKNSKLGNVATGLANSLRGFGTGVMKNYWDKINELTMPTLLITGSEDSKFTNLNVEMSEKMKGSIHHIVEGAGHNVHLEKPTEFYILLKNFLMNIDQ